MPRWMDNARKCRCPAGASIIGAGLAALALLGLWAAADSAAGPAENEGVRPALDQAAVGLAEGRFREILTVLEPVEAVEPENPWLWFYRGAALAGLGDAYPALESFDRALAVLDEAGDPDPALAAEIRRRRAAARREVVSFSLQTGWAYDTNVSFAGAGAESLGIVAGRGDAKFTSGFSFRFAPVKNERDTLAVGLRVGQAWYCEVEAFNFEDYGAALRYSRLLGNGWDASLTYDYAYDRLGHDNFLSNHTLTAAIGRSWEPRPVAWQHDRITMFYQVQFQDFLFPSEPRFDRDGIVHGVGLEQGWLVRPVKDRAWTCAFRLGYRFESTSTEGTEFDSFAHDFYLGLGVPVVRPWNLEQYLFVPDKELVFRFDADWYMADYRNRSRIDANRDTRNDLIATLGFTLSQTLLKDPEWGELILHGIIEWTDANSNVTARRGVSPYTYDKVVYGLQLQWSW